MSGTVNIARSLFLDEAFKDQPFTEREAFMWLVMEASWKDRVKRVGAAVVELKRGQLAASIRFMADAWSWEKSTVDRFLKRLEKRDMIGTECGTGVSVITIRKYNDYQGGETQSGTAEKEKRDSSGTAAGQTRTPEAIPDEEEREPIGSPKKSTSPPKSRRRPEVPLPPDWVPSDRNISDAQARQFSAQEINHEADRFRNHHLARDTRFRDWDAAWRTWLGNARRFAPRGGAPGKGGGMVEAFAAVAAARSGHA